ncbi:hypothetical protein [Pantoea sp. KPR_PJ]|uniref:hypothetical protein n=1 Tax=Pantoea sp. KPR_PJ TaxID=2738375 RepID=UPI0035274F5A
MMNVLPKRKVKTPLQFSTLSGVSAITLAIIHDSLVVFPSANPKDGVKKNQALLPQCRA